ncbi:ABC transporter permease subunit [Planococcus sp. APC 4015]|nr:ABC transporter permease subunit [Planococcus sp. APC 4015]
MSPASALTASHGWSRALRVAATIALIVWFGLPFLPLLLWAGADGWSYPAPLPTSWGARGLEEAAAFGAVPGAVSSLLLALCVAVIATPLGALAARALTFGSVPAPRLVGAVLLSPIALPPVVAVLGVNVVLLRAYIPPAPGVVLVLVVLALPYTTFVMRTAYNAYDRGYEDGARLLGADAVQVFLRVQLPLIAPALARAAFLAFLVAWSDYVVTVIVGGGEIVTLPLVVASAASAVGNDSAVAVMSLAAIIPPIVLLLAALSFGRRRPRSGSAPVAAPESERILA